MDNLETAQEAVDRIPVVSKEEISQGANLSRKNIYYIYALAATAFLFFSIDIVQRDPLYWLISYSRFWVFFTIPQMTVLDTFGNI